MGDLGGEVLGKGVTVSVVDHFVPNVICVLAHSGFETRLGGTDVNFACGEAAGLVDDEAVLALVVEFAASSFISSTVTFFGFKVFRSQGCLELLVEICFE